jgi:two-component system OmpR family sensor kinase
VEVDSAVLAVDLTPDRDTVARLVLIEVVAALAVAVGVGLATAAVVRHGLRPLSTMAMVARSIAGGDRAARMPTTSASAETADLTAALNDALDQREAAEKALRPFVADASHELRTPLTTVHGWADLYLQGGLAPDQVDGAMERIERDATRMRRIVDDLGMLARLDAHVPVQVRPVDLVTLVRELADDARVVAPDHTITFQVDGGPDAGAEPVVAECDAERVAQVVRNLLGNAIQHTPAGTTVAVDVAQDGDDAVLRVDDDGPGVSADDLPHLFDRFYRGRGRGPRDGSGLGLPIVQGIAVAHGGTVDVQSTPGTGTHVRVRLPVRGPAPSS